jgi:hypothetical protein
MSLHANFSPPFQRRPPLANYSNKGITMAQFFLQGFESLCLISLMF